MRATKTILTLLVPSLIFTVALLFILSGLGKDPRTNFFATVTGRFLCYGSGLLSAGAVTALCIGARDRSTDWTTVVVGLAALHLLVCPPAIVMAALVTTEPAEGLPRGLLLYLLPILNPRGLALFLVHMACTTSAMLLYRMSVRRTLIAFGVAILIGVGVHASRYDLETALEEDNRFRGSLFLMIFPGHPQGGEALLQAIGSDDLDRVRWLLECGARPDYLEPSTGKTLLHLSVAGVTRRGIPLEHAGAISAELLGHGADVNARDDAGQTPLMGCGFPDQAELLLARGADVNARDDRGRTAVFTAIASAHYVDLVRTLVEHGIDLEARDEEGHTVIHYLVEDAGHLIGRPRSPRVRRPARPGRLDVLLEAGLDINARDREGARPLHLAVRKMPCRRQVIAALLEKGADPNARDKAGRTPLDLAVERGEPWLVRALRRKAPAMPGEEE